MRSRKREEIKADFERTFPQRKEEQLQYHRDKLLLEAILGVHENIEFILKIFAEKTLDKIKGDIRKQL